jgi:hypothetical protein
MSLFSFTKFFLKKKKKKVYIFENFNNSENNIISVKEAAKVVPYTILNSWPIGNLTPQNAMQ